MLVCQKCKKQNANVHLTEITDKHGQKRERHLCNACAVEDGIMGPQALPVPLNQMLGALIKAQPAVQELASLCCPRCKLTFVEFRNTGQLGCPHDYDAFEKHLVPLIERAHESASHHVGKIPRRLDEPRAPADDLVRLRGELSRAVLHEQFEKAARLRDQIKTLETQG